MVALPQINADQPPFDGAATRMVPYDAYEREHQLRLKAERDRDYWQNEFYLQRKIRRAPVLQPVTKAVLEECRHVEKWGTVKAPDGSTRANFTTIAQHLKVSPDTVARQAERLEKLGIVEIHEHQGPKDERDRKYIRVKEDKLRTIDQLTDPQEVIPKQGGNRYPRCMQCDGEMEVRTITRKRTKVMLRCIDCHHESTLEEDLEDTVEDSGWKRQNGQKAQKQVAFPDNAPAERDAPDLPRDDAQNQVAEHCVDTRTCDAVPASVEKQVAFAPDHHQAIPNELKALPQWVVWRYEPKKDKDGNLIPGAKPDKVPYIARLARLPQHALCNDPATWVTYEQAQAIYEQSHQEGWKQPWDGLMFAFKKDGGYVGVDFDRDRESGQMKDEQALAHIEALNTYGESSPNNGVHCIARGSIPRNINNQKRGIEMYDHDHFLTFTGNHLEGTPVTTKDRQAELDALFAEIAPAVVPIALKDEETRQHNTTVYTPSCPCSDAEVLDKARNNGTTGAKFRALYDDGSIGGYPSQSESDLALCAMLAYWSNYDEEMVRRLFMQSKLYRHEKWNRKARAGETYGDGTIRRAMCAKREAVA